MNAFRMLVVEDDEQVGLFLQERLIKAGYDVRTATSGRSASRLFETAVFDAALIDIHLPDMLGIELLEAAKTRDPELDVVVMTGFPELDTAIQALRLGASDYLIKPLEWVSLQRSIDRIIEHRYLRREVATLRSKLAGAPAVGELIGCSGKVQGLKETLAKVAPTDAAVLIEGESGTGKELIANAIHRLSQRSTGPFVPVNCAAIPEELIESELFGHRKGAFSGAASDAIGLFRSANGGTLFLDELGELPIQLQPKLLRVLQDKAVRPVGSTQLHPVDVRIVAATNQNLEAAVAAGRFRRDLYFRLNVVRLETVPLRDMKADIPALVGHFLRRLNDKFGRRMTGVEQEAMQALQAYDFPGNVRELENMLERAYVLGCSGEIKLRDLPALTPAPRRVTTVTGSRAQSLADLERELILATLRNNANDKVKAAEVLGFSERTLYRRLKKLGVN